MNKYHYWSECISVAMDDCRINLNDDQLRHIVSHCVNAHEMYYEYSGYSVATSNFHAHKEDEIKKLQKELKKEREKQTCKTCLGSGTLSTFGPHHMSTSECHACYGHGRK